jgi:hypothetical protein
MTQFIAGGYALPFDAFGGGVNFGESYAVTPQEIRGFISSRLGWSK